MKFKKKCFIALGGGGRNSLATFMEHEENAEFILLDTQKINEKGSLKKHRFKYSTQVVDSESLEKVFNQFPNNKSYVLLASLSYSEYKKKAGTTLVRAIATHFSKCNYDFTMILSTPFSNEYTDEKHEIINEIKRELVGLGKTIVINLDEYREKYGDLGFNILSEFHYMAWKDENANITP